MTAIITYRVPAANLLGAEGRGFYHLMGNLPQERLGIAVYAIAHADRAFAVTRGYAQDRHAFGRPIGGFQVNRFALAEMKTKLDVAHAYLDRCVQAAMDGELAADEAAGAKWWATELQWEIVDRCLQLHIVALRLNTHGGSLSKGGSQGAGHLREAVTQLRGQAGPRQVPGARVALLTPGGFFFNAQGLVLRAAEIQLVLAG